MSSDVVRPPKVSIGMPVRNGGELLSVALRSVLNQTEQDFELIISDNGSDDGSSELLCQLAADDPRVRYFRQDPVIRAYDNFHFVLGRARGEFFMWAAHDDTRDLDFIERLMAVLNENQDAVLAFGDLIVVSPTDPVGKPHPFPFQTKEISTVARLWKLSRMQCFYLYGLWRTSAIKRVPYAYCAWWPDLPMMLAAASIGTFLYVPNTRFNYFEIPKSNLDRVKGQDYGTKFFLPSGVASLVAATYTACKGTGGMLVGIYAASLVILKQALNLPGFLYRRVTRDLKSR
jgi:glycosyltransferase involved in cell wall biosynthesis